MSEGRNTEKKAAKKSKCGIFLCLFPWMRRRKACSQSPLVENAEEHNHQVTDDNVTENILNSSPKQSTPPTTDSHIGSFKLMKFGSVDVSSFGCFRRSDLGKPGQFLDNFDVLKENNIRYSSLPILPGSSTNKVVLGERCKSIDMTGSYIDYIGSSKLFKFGSYNISDFGCLRRTQYLKPILEEIQHSFEVELESILLSDVSSDRLSIIMECDEDNLEDSSSCDTTT